MTHFKAGNRIHFVGVGGIGMSGLARLALAKGCTVSGSDMNASTLTVRLSEDGALIHVGHADSHISEDVDLVVYSEAIPPDNVERLKANELNLNLMNYFEALGDFSSDYRVVAIAGTHGKTTTTSMLALILKKAGLNPTILVGSTLKELDGLNSELGGELFVVEACEYRENFLPLSPEILGILNIDYDHVDYFKTEESYQNAFEKLAKKTLQDVDGKVIWPGEYLMYLPELAIPGDFNQMNAGMATKIAKDLGVNEDIIDDVLAEFKGAARRFEYKGKVGQADAYDDYAHHPTEIKATLGGMKGRMPSKRRVVVFQPHQHSRTLELLEGFKCSFGDADELYVPNIYKARDTQEEIDSMSVQRFISELKASYPDKMIHGPFDIVELKEKLERELTQDDVLIVMGAGDISRFWL